MAPTTRLARKIRQDFPDRADDVIARLTELADTSQAPERVQAAIIVRSQGDFAAFLSELDLVAIETPAGEAAYVAQQSEFSERGAPIRRRMIGECQRLQSI